MRNCEKYLVPDNGGYRVAVQDAGLPISEDWIEIPEGAEIAIQFKNDPDEYGIVFYKNGGKSCMGKNDNNWQNDAMWTIQGLLNENYCEDGIDLSHDILWQRATHPEELPFIDDNPQSLNDQYAEIEEVRQQTIESTLSQRQSTYGCYEDVAHVTQQILSALRVGNYDKLPAPMKESLHMIASKMARIVNGDPEYLDNWHDIGGYAKLIEKLIKGE